MLRCAARIKAGSALASAFSAAARAPGLIASSTVRTAPRIWVRRDLLTAVRRAILRVAFLAEVVLAMSQISSAATGRSDRVGAGCLTAKSTLGSGVFGASARLFFGQERQPCGSTSDCSKYSGGGIAPAASWRPYRGGLRHRHRLSRRQRSPAARQRLP